MPALLSPTLAAPLRRGLVIPACPLALNEARRLDERRQRAVVRYYADAGAGGLAVAVHTTQFAIRDPKHALFQPVLALVAEELDRADSRRTTPLVRIAGACGSTPQATAEASLARDLGYHAALLSLAALRDANDDALIDHCRAVAAVLPVVGFYLQPAVGGRLHSYRFWRRLFDLEGVVAVKIAPFDRYKTLDVVRAAVDSDRDDLALYTGNDDAIVADLITPFRFGGDERRIVGGLLGQWAVGTRAAVKLLEECHALAATAAPIPPSILRLGVELTDLNAALFDAANGFAGCLPGIHELLRRQGLLAGSWCLDPGETLSPGQLAEIDRVAAAYPYLTDTEFVAQNLDLWLSS